MIAECGPFVVRDIAPWEGAKVFRMTGDAETMKYMGFACHTSEAQATELITRYQNARAKWLAVCPKEDPSDVYGVVGFEVQGHSATITDMFRRDWKARGSSRRFLVPFIQWIFTHPTIWRVWCYCHVDNVPAQRVLERIGATQEGYLRQFEYFPNLSEVPQDVFVYSIVRG